MSHILENIEEKAPENLPENAVLEFLLNCNSTVIRDIRYHLNNYIQIPFIHFHSGSVFINDSNFNEK